MRALIVFVMLIGSAAAHPLPSLRYDRTLTVTFAADGVTVDYVLELSTWSMLRDPEHHLTDEEKAEIASAPPSRRIADTIYIRKKADLLLDNLIVSLDGQPLVFQQAAAPVLRPNLDHEEIHFRYYAAWPVGVTNDKSMRFKIHDSSFDNVSGSWKVTFANWVMLDDIYIIPQLTDRRTYEYRVQIQVPLGGKTDPKPVDPVVAFSSESLWQDLRSRGLIALFDSDHGLLILLLAALFFGAAHAFTPGHGKALVAAYLVGEHGTVRHAVVLGISTTLAHTGSVIALALILKLVYQDAVPAAVQGWLQLTGGLMIAFIGIWLLRQRLLKRADHVHLKTGSAFGWWRVILLGLAGGLVPCWDAVLLLLLAISLGKLSLAIPLLLAFSLGLAMVLVLLGIGVVITHRRGGRSFGEKRWFRALPLASAVLLAVLGLLMAREGIDHLGELAKGP